MAYAVPGLAGAVTAVSAGVTFAPPSAAGQGGFGWAVVNNVSPWVAMVVGGANGAVTLQPYTADIAPIGGNQTLNITMSVPTGGSATAATGSLTYIQIDWYVLGNGPPLGTYPISLTSQAVQAAIAGTVTFPQTLLATILAGGTTATVTLPTNCESITILQETSGVPYAISVQGTTSGFIYPGVPVTPYVVAGQQMYWRYPVSSAIDPQITVTLAAAAPGSTYIVSDSSVLVTSPMPESEAVQVAGVTAGNVGIQIMGTDGTRARAASMDANGRLALPPVISSAQSNANVTTANPGTAAAFGPVNQALLLKTLTMSLNIVGYTTAGVIILNFTVWNGAAYQAVGSVSLALSGVSPLSLDANIALDFGPGGLSSPAAGAGNPQFKVSWSYQITVATVISGNEVCTATYT
jgi:hypothetical protein